MYYMKFLTILFTGASILINTFPVGIFQAIFQVMCFGVAGQALLGNGAPRFMDKLLPGLIISGRVFGNERQNTGMWQ